MHTLVADELKHPALTQRRVKQLALLHQARERRAQNAWLLEGSVLLAEALAAGCAPRLVCADEHQSERHAELLQRAEQAGAELTLIDERAASKLADREHGPALFSVIERPPAFDGSLSSSGPVLLLGLCGLQDPGNLGTLLRSARAFGAHAVLLAPGGVEPGNPKVLRSSAGAAVGLPLGRLEQLGDLIKGSELSVRAAVAPSSEEFASVIQPPASADPTPPERLVLLLGHETRGLHSTLSELQLERAPERWSLRQEPEVESLNVAVAGSILMADWYRRWR